MSRFLDGPRAAVTDEHGAWEGGASDIKAVGLPPEPGAAGNIEAGQLLRSPEEACTCVISKTAPPLSPEVDASNGKAGIGPPPPGAMSTEAFCWVADAIDGKHDKMATDSFKLAMARRERKGPTLVGEIPKSRSMPILSWRMTPVWPKMKACRRTSLQPECLRLTTSW